MPWKLFPQKLSKDKSRSNLPSGFFTVDGGWLKFLFLATGMLIWKLCSVCSHESPSLLQVRTAITTQSGTSAWAWALSTMYLWHSMVTECFWWYMMVYAATRFIRCNISIISPIPRPDWLGGQRGADGCCLILSCWSNLSWWTHLQVSVVKQQLAEKAGLFGHLGHRDKGPLLL